MSTPGDRWQQLETLFHAVADLSAEERAAYFDQHEADAQLRDEIEQLVAAEPDGRTLVPAVVRGSARNLTGLGIVDGESIGPWRVLQPLSEGGMGAVYLAERADGQFRQRVAVKLLSHALPDDEMMARFVNERQILADLNHPNIARLLDGGATVRGTPYLVMEYVQGQAIHHYCRDRALPLTERLRMVQKLCAAVHAAHQRQIVHRDIKPSNVLVDEFGEPRLLDFGIAKLLDAGATASPQPTLQLMTPEYASPEQVRGEAIGIASDVYALGVLLFHLVTGESPYARWRSQPLALQNAICTQDPARPSDRLDAADAAALRHAQKRDLDHVTMKAMRKDPAQRYDSAAALASDLQSLIENRPVAARPRNAARILVVDDEPDNIHLLGELLSAEGYVVAVARSGEEALDEIERTMPDLVLLDVVMPGMSGYEVCERLRGHSVTEALPVILVTGERPEEDRVRGLEAGADEFLTKPVNRAELMARVRGLLRVQQLHRQIAEWNEKLESRVAEQVAQLERLAHLKNFLPQRVAEAIVDGGEALLQPQRRQIAVCVIDLRGFTPFSETAEPEEVLAVLREFYSEMGAIVEAHDGAVELFAGDSMTLFFNAPVEIPAPEEQAVRCALAMRARFAVLRERWAQSGHQLGLGIGLAQGYASVGAIGFAGRWQYTAIGAVTNMAARLCAAATHGEIRTTQKFFARVQSIVEAEPLGEQAIKGFARQVTVLRLLGLR